MSVASALRSKPPRTEATVGEAGDSVRRETPGRTVKLRSLHLSSEHGNFVSQNEQLAVLGGIGTSRKRDELKKPA